MRRLQASLKGKNRPFSVIQVHWRERLLLDRKAGIAYEEIIVRRGIQSVRPLFHLLEDVGRADPLGRPIANPEVGEKPENLCDRREAVLPVAEVEIVSTIASR
jgi:hypothetical protein